MESDNGKEDNVLSALNHGNPHSYVASAATAAEQTSSTGNGYMRGSSTIQEDTASSNEPYNMHGREYDIMVNYHGDLGSEAVRSCGRDMLVNVDYEQARMLTGGRRPGTEDKLQMQPSSFGIPGMAEQGQEDGEKQGLSNCTTSNVARPSMASASSSVESCKSKDSMCGGAKTNSARKIMVSNLPRHSRRSKSKEINWLRDTLSLTSSTHSEFISTSMHSAEFKGAIHDVDELHDSNGEFGCAMNGSSNRMNGNRHSNKSARSGVGGHQRNSSSPGFLKSSLPPDLLPSEAPRHGPLPAILACSGSQSEGSSEQEIDPITQCNEDCEQCPVEPEEEEKEEVPFKWITATISTDDQEELPPPPPRDSPNSPRSKRWEAETEDIPDPTPRSVTPPKNAPTMPTGGYSRDVISDVRRGPPSTRGARVPATNRDRPNRHHSSGSHRDPRDETQRPPIGHRRNASDLGDYSVQSHRSNRQSSPYRQGGSSISGSSRYQRDRSPDRPPLPDVSRSGYSHRRSMNGSGRYPGEISDISRSGYSDLSPSAYSRRDRSPGGHSRRDRSLGGYSRREGSPERYSRRDSSPARRPSLRNPSPHRRGGDDRSMMSRRQDEGHRSLRDPSPHRRGEDDRSLMSRRPDEGRRTLRDHSPHRRGEDDRSLMSRRPDEGRRSLRDHSPHRRGGDDPSLRSRRRPDEGSLYPSLTQQRGGGEERSVYSRRQDEASLYPPPREQRSGGEYRSVYSHRPDEAPFYPPQREHRGGEDRSIYSRRPDDRSAYPPTQRGGGDREVGDRPAYNSRQISRDGEDRSMYNRRAVERRRSGDDPSLYSRRGDDRSAYPPYTPRQQRGGGDEYSRRIDDRSGDRSYSDRRREESYDRDFSRRSYGEDAHHGRPHAGHGRRAFHGHEPHDTHPRDRNYPDVHVRSSNRHPSREDDSYYRDGSRYHEDDSRRRGGRDHSYSERGYSRDDSAYDGYPERSYYEDASGRQPQIRDNRRRDRSDVGPYSRSPHDEDRSGRDAWHRAAPTRDSRYDRPSHEADRSARDGRYGASLHDDGRYGRPPQEDRSARDRRYGAPPEDDRPSHRSQRDEDRGARDGRHRAPSVPPPSEPSPHEGDRSARDGRYGASPHDDGRYDRPPHEEDRSARDRRYGAPPADDGPSHRLQRNEDQGARDGRHRAPSVPPPSEPSPTDDESGWMDQDMLHEKLLNSGMSRKGSDGAKEEQVYVEISPGVKQPLRRTHETLQAIAIDFYQSVCCISCTKDVLCIADVCYVICPNCRVISPVVGEYFEGREVHRHGLGLGFTCESLFKMQNEIMQDRSKYEKKEPKTPARAPASEFRYEKLKPASISTSHY